MLYMGFMIVSNGIFSRSLAVYRAEEEEKGRVSLLQYHAVSSTRRPAPPRTTSIQRRAGAVVGVSETIYVTAFGIC